MLNPLQALDAGRFTAMLERPLFNPGRAERPPEPPPEPPPPPRWKSFRPKCRPNLQARSRRISL
jgi:hypothetical protein